MDIRGSRHALTLRLGVLAREMNGSNTACMVGSPARHHDARRCPSPSPVNRHRPVPTHPPILPYFASFVVLPISAPPRNPRLLSSVICIAGGRGRSLHRCRDPCRNPRRSSSLSRSSSRSSIDPGRDASPRRPPMAHTILECGDLSPLYCVIDTPAASGYTSANHLWGYLHGFPQQTIPRTVAVPAVEAYQASPKSSLCITL